MPGSRLRSPIRRQPEHLVAGRFAGRKGRVGGKTVEIHHCSKASRSRATRKPRQAPPGSVTRPTLCRFAAVVAAEVTTRPPAGFPPKFPECPSPRAPLHRTPLSPHAAGPPSHDGGYMSPHLARGRTQASLLRLAPVRRLTTSATDAGLFGRLPPPQPLVELRKQFQRIVAQYLPANPQCVDLTQLAPFHLFSECLR